MRQGWPHRIAAALACIAALSAFTRVAHAGGAGQRHHALSLVDPPAHGPDFRHFDWVNPNAPKGGRMRLRATGSFDTLNPFTIKGSPASGLLLVYDTLMASSLAEPSAEYGLVAEWVSHPQDYSSATFGLRPAARFHDGKPVTPEDVVFSLQAVKAASPRYALYFQDVVTAEKTGANEVTFRFAAKGNRELPHIIGSLPVLPRHYWQAKGPDGIPRDPALATMDVPLGSGPYRIADVDPGRSITYRRVADWWAKDLPVSRGQWNFDTIAYVYYRDRTPAFEGFKSGEIDFWPENSAKGWATGYDIDPVRAGHIKRELIPSKDIATMQGFVFNLRRRQFADPRVRQAFNLAFNFEWFNKNMFYDQYTRVGSYFENSQMKATGLPQGRELEMLDALRADLPPALFDREWRNPVNVHAGDFRNHMRQAARLLVEAGWTMRDGVLTSADGDKLEAEFLLVQPDFERLVLAYKTELERLGMRITIRTVDSAQYRRRLDRFDFDIVVAGFRQSLSPGNEQREYWGSTAAEREGARNIMGIKNPAIDALIEKIVYAPDRVELVAAARALDRALLWGHYLVPQFYAPAERCAYWNKFARPAKAPGHASVQSAAVRTWWYDPQAADGLPAERR